MEASAQRVESFQVALAAEELPPKPQWVIEQLQARLDEDRLIQWAIVGLDTVQRQLRVEGCKLVFERRTNP